MANWHYWTAAVQQWAFIYHNVDGYLINNMAQYTMVWKALQWHLENKDKS